MKPALAIDSSKLFSSLDLSSRGSVIVAVSGGSDSTALLLLFKDYLDRLAPKTRLVAVTVDHALRPESADEAAEVGRLCAGAGVPHRILTWTGDKPATGLAAAAREARHNLVAVAACAEQSDLVLTGHTADDQAETVLMRQGRDEPDQGGRGLAGIAPATLFDGRVWFARPLLSTRRQALRAVLERNGIGWIEDPTNVDERHERPRLRKRLGKAGGEAMIAEALKIAADAARRRESVGREAAAFIRDHADCPAPGLMRLQPDSIAGAHKQAAIYALRILLAVAGGASQLPDEARTATLCSRLAADGPVRTVLSRTLVDRRKTGIFLLREARDLPGRDAVRDSAIWDGRYRIRQPSAGAVRRPDAAARRSAEPVPDSLARLAIAVGPPLQPGWTAIPLLAPWARYLPSFDMAPACAVADLIGAAAIPMLPFREHNESGA